MSVVFVTVASCPDYMNEMTTDTPKSAATHEIRLDLDWRWHRPKRRPDLPKGEPRDDERPIRCIEGDAIHPATTSNLPYPDGSCPVVDCGTVFAYVRNDEALARELRRVVPAGGRIHLRVPATGPLAGLDAFNLHRYLVDITGRGLRPFETADIGWRRHYSIDDIVRMLDPEAFTVEAHRSFGLAGSEAVRMSGFLAFRWLRPSRNRYRVVSGLAERLHTVEERIETRNGFWLDITCVRR